MAYDHDLPVGLDGNGFAIVDKTAKVESGDAVTIEARVQASIQVVADECEPCIDSEVRASCCDDLAICLECNALSPVYAVDVGIDKTVAAKGCIQAAVAVVARETKVFFDGCVLDSAYNNNLAVRLNGELSTLISVTEKVGRDLSVGIEGSIETAVGVVACQRKVACSRRARLADDNDLAIRLNVDISGPILTCAEIRGHKTVAVKAGIQGAIGVVAGDSKIVVRPVMHVPDDYDLAVRLDGDAVRVVFAGAEISRDITDAAEGGI